MEEALQKINGTYISMDINEVRASNVTLNTILRSMVSTMRRVSPLFDEMFETFMYGGSFYDGLKVGHPDEFDIDLVLYLPSILNVEIIPTSQHGFVNVYLKDWSRFCRDNEIYTRFKELEKLKDSSNYLIQENVLRWMQKTVSKALNIIHIEGQLRNIEPFEISFSMGGPAVTLRICQNKRLINVDLVAVFRIPENKWPKSPFRSRPNDCYHNNFYVVPKAPKSDIDYRTRFWRLSFQEQEQYLLNGNYFCKPVLRLLKKLRDTRDHNIPSYFIKTIFLWKVEETKHDFQFWNRSLNLVFMEMLLTYKNYLDRGNIPYYWNKKNNLLQYTKSETINNIRQFLQRMINTINRESAADPYIIAKFLLPANEYIELRSSIIRTPESARYYFEEYNKFEEKINSSSSSTLFKFLAGAAIIGGALFLSSNPH